MAVDKMARISSNTARVCSRVSSKGVEVAQITSLSSRVRRHRQQIPHDADGVLNLLNPPIVPRATRSSSLAPVQAITTSDETEEATKAKVRFRRIVLSICKATA